MNNKDNNQNKDHNQDEENNHNKNKKKNKKKNLFLRFKNFVTRGNVVSLAVGLIIGNAFTSVINGFVKDIIMPLVSLISGKVDLTQLKWVLSPERGSKPEIAIMYGEFIQVGINFLAIALCVFFFCILVGDDPNKISTKDEAKKAQGEKTNQLLEEIRDLLKGNKQSN